MRVCILVLQPSGRKCMPAFMFCGYIVILFPKTKNASENVPETFCCSRREARSDNQRWSCVSACSQFGIQQVQSTRIDAKKFKAFVQIV